jgi:hypothetical protein
MNNCSYRLVIVLFLVILTSCGSLKITPKGCRTSGLWGNQSLEDKNLREFSFTQEYYVWNTDQIVKLKDILADNKMSCDEVKNLHLEIRSEFFIKRIVTVYIQK